MSLGRLAAFGIALQLVLACSAYRPVTGDPSPAGKVVVTFAPPRDLTARGPNGEVVRYPAVRDLWGTVTAVAADTLHVRLSRVRLVSMSVGVLEGSIVAIPRDSAMRIGEGSSGGTAAMGAIVVAATGLALIAIIVAINGSPLK